MRRVKVHLAELGGGVGMWLYLSYWGIPSFIPWKKTICRKKKNTVSILHTIMNKFYAVKRL